MHLNKLFAFSKLQNFQFRSTSTGLSLFALEKALVGVGVQICSANWVVIPWARADGLMFLSLDADEAQNRDENREKYSENTHFFY